MFKRISLALLLVATATLGLAEVKKPAAPAIKNGAAKSTTMATSKLQATVRTGVVDFEKIMRECEQARDVSVRLQEEAVKRQNDFGKKVQEYQKQSKDGKISKEDAQKKELAFSQEARDVQQEIEQLSTNAQQELFAAIQLAAEVVAQKHGLDAYTPKFLFAKESVDFTDEIIAEANRAYKAKKSAQKFKGAQPTKKAQPATPGKKA